jgi:Flp pilus assembly protein TadG
MFQFIQRIHRRDRGQILVIFAVALVAIVAMVGLVLDGGAAFAQRRSQQNASDLASLAGANTYLLTADANATIAAARAVAAQNGWVQGTDSVNIPVTINTSNGVKVTVNVDAPHHNNFGSIVGMSTFQVGTTATAESGYPDTAEAAGPLIFSIDAFGTNGVPLPLYGNKDAPFAFGEGNGDVPNGPGDIAWTNYGTGNVDTNQVRSIINGSLVITKTLAFGEYIGQHNQGNHTALYSDVATYLIDQDIAIPVVDHNGNYQGWATFHVTGAAGGSTKKIYGYFKAPYVNQRLSVGTCSTSCPRYLGSYVLKLIN